MRPKVVFGVLFLALLLAGVLLLLKQRTGHTTVAVAVAPVLASPEVVATPPLPLAAPAPVVAAPRVLTDEERQDAIDEEVDRLQDWSRNSDPQSLSHILGDLTNSEQQVREAAIEAAKQFGSTNAIPALKAAAFSTTDADEQMEMLEAANFLTLPPINLDTAPLTPEQAQAAAQRRAQRLQGRQGQNQSGQPGPASSPPTQN